MRNKKILLLGCSLVLLCILVVVFCLSMKKTDKKEYKIILQNENSNIVMYVKENDVIPRLEDPVKEGYNFIGWYYNGVLFDFKTKIKSDMTLEARFEEAKEIELEKPSDDLTGDDKENIDDANEGASQEGSNSGSDSSNSSNDSKPSNSQNNGNGSSKPSSDSGNSGNGSSSQSGNTGSSAGGSAESSGNTSNQGGSTGSTSESENPSENEQKEPKYTIKLTARYLLDKIKNYSYVVYKDGVVFEDYAFMSIYGSKYRKGAFIDPETVDENGKNAVTIFLNDNTTVMANID